MTDLNYPLDAHHILRKKGSIKRALLETDKLLNLNVAILGGSTTSEIKNILELFLLDRGVKATFYESDYNKYYEDSLFGSSDLEAFSPDIIYIHVTNKNICKYPDLSASIQEIEQLLENEISRYKEMWTALKRFDCTIIQNNFDYPLNRSLGNLDSYDVHGRSWFINRLNKEFSESARDIGNLFINDINYLSAHLGIRHWFDPSLWHRAKYAVSMDAIPELALNITNIILAIKGLSKKCLILDLDNTCWGGVIGDDGLHGISIGQENAISESFTEFQNYVSELRDRGITLAVCSKNDLKNAEEGFSHPDSVLNLTDFTSFKANWDGKDLNIEAIAQDINIGLDSLVFIDDNPVEREIVSSQLPSVAVPNVGNDVIDFIDYIDRNGYFEPISLSKDDFKRNEYYKSNNLRNKEKATYANYGEFLVSLKMKAQIFSFSEIYLERIAQLTNKTNQFNLTTKRYSLPEIDNIARDSGYIKFYGKLADKFGDNGLISIIVGRLKNDTCLIDLWLMSCRVLKRDMESAMLDDLVRRCRSLGVTKIEGNYYMTEKNSMVENLYSDFGFTLVATNKKDTTWVLDLSSYKNMNKTIEVEHD